MRFPKEPDFKKRGNVYLSPIVMFVFNRPVHTKNTIESLKKNPLASKSKIIFFSDGPRNETDEINVKLVRSYIDSLQGFMDITIFKRPTNMGLARSVISGVTDVISEYGSAIVIEDDLLFSPYFLSYMNQALEIYENDFRIFSIGGYSPRINIPKTYHDDSYLSYRCCTWGWATWKDRWKQVDWEISDYNDFIRNKKLISLFNRGGNDMTNLLQMQMDGKINSWGIRWDYAHFKKNAYCFRPTVSLVENTGNDGTGVHCGVTTKFDVLLNKKDNLKFPNPFSLKVNKKITKEFALFYDEKKINKLYHIILLIKNRIFLKKIMFFIRKKYGLQ